MGAKYVYRVNGRKPLLRSITADGHAGGVPRKIETTYSAPGEKIYTQDEVDFLMAIDAFKIRYRRWPTDPEVLAIAKRLGYEKVAEPLA